MLVHRYVYDKLCNIYGEHHVRKYFAPLPKLIW